MGIQDHLEKLKYFYEVAKTGSIKEASQVLYLTQPTVTKSIKVLEEAVGTPLFIRHPRGVFLTREGELLKKYCHTHFAQLKNLEQKLKTPNDQMAGSLRVGTYDSIAIYFWPKFLKKFMNKYPNINLELTTDRSSKVLHKVEGGELDLGLIIEPVETPMINRIVLNKDSFQLYASLKMPRAKQLSADTPLIYMSDALAGGSHNRLGNILPIKNKFTKHFKTSSLESAKELIIKGLGVGLLPRMVAFDALKNKKIAKVSLPDFPKKGTGRHSIGLVYLKNNLSLTPLEIMVEELKNQRWI